MTEPVGEEFLLQFASGADAVAAQRAQGVAEVSAGWMCAEVSQCRVTPVSVGDVGVPVVAVSFRLGARGNLSEVNDLAIAVKGRYLVNFGWISASTVSANRVTPPEAARAFLVASLRKLPTDR